MWLTTPTMIPMVNITSMMLSPMVPRIPITMSATAKTIPTLIPMVTIIPMMISATIHTFSKMVSPTIPMMVSPTITISTMAPMTLA